MPEDDPLALVNQYDDHFIPGPTLEPDEMGDVEDSEPYDFNPHPF